jgi:hypothetical protein
MLASLRKPVAFLLAAIMVLSALLHLYWALGGTWFLETALNMPLATIPPRFTPSPGSWSSPCWRSPLWPLLGSG